MDFDLRDKVAIVTGSSRGLGLASARALAAEGCCVTLCARTDKTLQEVPGTWPSLPEAQSACWHSLRT